MHPVDSLSLFAGGIGSVELIIICLVVLLVFGSRLPEVMRSFGRGLTQFKKGLKDVENEIVNDVQVPGSATGAGSERADAAAPGDDTQAGR
jgi:sec-independent protein translocase protein TatA